MLRILLYTLQFAVQLGMWKGVVFIIIVKSISFDTLPLAARLAGSNGQCRTRLSSCVVHWRACLKFIVWKARVAFRRSIAWREEGIPFSFFVMTLGVRVMRGGVGRSTPRPSL